MARTIASLEHHKLSVGPSLHQFDAIVAAVGIPRRDDNDNMRAQVIQTLQDISADLFLRAVT